MTTEVSFDSSSIQMLLLIGIIILMGVYFYYENYKLKNQLLEFQYKIDKLTELVNPSKNIEKGLEFQSHIQNELLNEQMNEHLNEQMNETMNETMNEQVNEQINEMMNEPINGNLNNTWSDIHNQMKNIEHDNPMIDDTEVEEIPIKNIDKQELPDFKESSDLDDINLDDMLKDIIIDKENVSGESGGTDGGGSGESDESNEIDYSKMTVSQLKNILIEKNLPVSGNKTKLIQRILDNSE